MKGVADTAEKGGCTQPLQKFSATLTNLWEREAEAGIECGRCNKSRAAKKEQRQQRKGKSKKERERESGGARGSNGHGHR